MRVSDDSLRGRTVIAADGHAIGEVASLYVETGTWQVESLQIKLRNEIADQLGVSRNIFHAGEIELAIRYVQSVGDAIVLSVPTDQLRQVPGPESRKATV